MNAANNHLLFETYKIHVDLAERVASLREGVNKLYSGMVTGIVSASLLLHRLVPDAATTWVLPTLGIVVSLSWMLARHSVSGRLFAKHEVLLALETELPFSFRLRAKKRVQERWLPPKEPYGIDHAWGLVLALCTAWLGFLVLSNCA